MDPNTSDGQFEVVFRGSDAEEPLQMTEFPKSISTDSSNLEAVSLSTGKLQQLSPSMSEPSTATEESHVHHLEEDSPLRETHSDPFSKPRWWREASSLSVIIASMIVFCFGITIALIIQILVGSPQVIPHAGVLSDDDQCSRIGIQALVDSSASSYETASSVDVAILTALCLIVKNPHKGGLGGGGFMLIEKQHEVKHDTIQINFREQSPNGTDATLSVARDAVPRGPSVAVPGFIRGMQVAHDTLKLGILKWEKIFKLAADLAAGGVKVSPDLASSLETFDLDSAPDELKQLLTKADNVTKLTVNDTLIQPQLAETLKTIGQNADNFYTGPLAQSLVDMLRSKDSKITMDDMKEYKALHDTETMKVEYANMSVAAVGPPSSGPVVLATLKNLVDIGKINEGNATDENLLTHFWLESLKFAYGARANWADDGSVNKSFQAKLLFPVDNQSYPVEHYLNGVQPITLSAGGSQHVTVIGPDGLIVTIVMGIGSPFGSKLFTSGYFLNDAMLDFCWPGKNTEDTSGLPVSEVNKIAGGKRPMSSMTPVLVVPAHSKCGLYLGYDAHDVNTAISAMLQMIMKKAAGTGIMQSITAPRLNQDITPYTVQAEANVSDELFKFLQEKKHNITRLPSGESLGICNTLSYLDVIVKAYVDPRSESKEVFVF